MNISDYLTYDEAAAILGTNRRGIYRIVDRAEMAGAKDLSVKVFGKRVIPKGKIEYLRSFYFPFGSEARHELAMECGRVGGQTKAENAKKRVRRRKKT
jgi:hypothetical protein